MWLYRSSEKVNINTTGAEIKHPIQRQRMMLQGYDETLMIPVGKFVSVHGAAFS